MLILTRHAGESLIIGDNICVTVLSVTHRGVPLSGVIVKLGVNAPAEVAVDREEIRVLKDSGAPPPVPSATHGLYGRNRLSIKKDK